MYKFAYEALVYPARVNLTLGRDQQAFTDPDLLLRNFLADGNKYVCYTDGSRSLGEIGSFGVSCASFSPETDLTIMKCLDGRASIVPAECAALLDAIQMASRFGDRNVFFSDSRSALEGIVSLVCSVASTIVSLG